MKYAKPPLTFAEQADLLISRGLEGDRDLMIERLSSVNYYRLSGYLYPFRGSGDSFAQGTAFESVWSRYAFDRRLRLLTLDAIERIEVAVRTWIAYHHSHAYGPFAYAVDPSSMSKLKGSRRDKFLDHVKDQIADSKEPFATHLRRKYENCGDFLPVWAATEVMTFGTILTFYRGTTSRVKRNVANEFGLPAEILESWLLTLNSIRNICAHHSRLWNRVLGTKPKMPRVRDYPEWHSPVCIENDRVFGVLTICRYCLSQIAPQSGWKDRLENLIAAFPSVPLLDMGFPPNWRDSAIWRHGSEVT